MYNSLSKSIFKVLKSYEMLGKTSFKISFSFGSNSSFNEKPLSIFSFSLTPNIKNPPAEFAKAQKSDLKSFLSAEFLLSGSGGLYSRAFLLLQETNLPIYQE